MNSDKEKKTGGKGILYFIFVLMPIVLFFIALKNTGDSGVSILAFLLYYIFLGLPLTIVSVINALKSIKKNKDFFSILSIIIAAITSLIIIGYIVSIIILL